MISSLFKMKLNGHVAEWLRRGLQILVSQFDSGRGLQFKFLNLIFKKKINCI